MYDIILLACDHNSWAVNVFVFLFDKYFPNATLTIVSEKNYLTISDRHSYLKLPDELIINGSCPRYKFSNSLIFALNNTPSKQAIVMLADYWLYNNVDVGMLQMISEYMANDETILRTDIGSHFIPNGLKNITPELFESTENRNLFFPVSLCPGLWNKEKYLSILQDGWDPWQTESIPCDKFLGHKHYGDKFMHLRSIWSHPGPIYYHNALRARDDTTLVARRETIDSIKHLIPSRFSYMFEN